VKRFINFVEFKKIVYWRISFPPWKSVVCT